jgi:glycosyltransferase involved in cell wall biosynthesis
MLPRERIAVIPNPVLAPDSAASVAEIKAMLPNRYFVAMGRLSPEKGFDLLLDAFARVEPARDVHLVIIGAGPAEEKLKLAAEELGIAARVIFLGSLRDPFSIIKGALAFVLSSRFEGFPNSLCEAMAVGVPALAFDCANGPAEIIRPDIDGILVPAESVEALAAAMTRLAGDQALRERLAIRASEVIDRFSISRIADSWQVLFDHTVNPAGEPTQRCRK